MAVIMVAMVVAMLALGHGHFGKTAHEHGAHEHDAQSQGHENQQQHK